MVPTIRESSEPQRALRPGRVSSLWIGGIWEQFMGVHLKLACEKRGMGVKGIKKSIKDASMYSP